MAQNFLYMFEFVVDDLLVTRPNKCAPEEFPTCCEISFRSSVFVAICDREEGFCVDKSAPKCGKCCLFSLESPITDKDRLLIHVFKKKNGCKFLLGAADMKVKYLFDKVTENFDIQNPEWMEMLARHSAGLINPKRALRRGKATQSQLNMMNSCSCWFDDEFEGRAEQFCPTYDMSKNLFPLYNMKGEQTGNLMLITRLVCNGPTIVSSFAFTKYCRECQPSPFELRDNRSKSCAPKICSSFTSSHTTNTEPCVMPDPCKKQKKPEEITVKDSRRYFSGYDGLENPFENLSCHGDYSWAMKRKPAVKKLRKAKSQLAPSTCPTDTDLETCATLARLKTQYGSSPCIKSLNSGDPDFVFVKPDLCKPIPKKAEPASQRYFACNADKGIVCDNCEDVCDHAKKENNSSKACGVSPRAPRQTGGESICLSKPKSRQSGSVCSMSDQCDDDDDDVRSSSEENSCMSPCFIKPSRPEPGPEAYEEFEACLNGSGLTVRVLKDTHKMESVYDGTEVDMDDSDNECCDPGTSNNCGNTTNHCATLEDILNSTNLGSNIARKALQRRTAGRIINHPSIPKVRANIKYAGADTGYVENYKLPFSKFKEYCNASNKLDEYRKKMPGCDCGPIEPPRHLDDTRNCCLQVDPTDIKNLLKGVNVDSRKKGIEVCYKTCEDNESDVFLVKLGSKKACERKQHSVEIELKTPKIPIPCPVQRCTTETQIKEGELDAALRGICKKGRKGKKGKRGKK